MDTVSNTMHAMQLYNILSVQRDNNLTLATWAKDFLSDGKELYLNLFNLFTETEFMKKAYVGALLTDIVSNFNALANGSTTVKIYQYSAHDTTVLGMIRLFNLSDQIPGIPGFGATLSLELKYTNGEYNVEAYYWDNCNVVSPQLLNFPDCPESCTLDKFNEAYNKFMIIPPETYESMCAPEPRPVKKTKGEL